MALRDALTFYDLVNDAFDVPPDARGLVLLSNGYFFVALTHSITFHGYVSLDPPPDTKRPDPNAEDCDIPALAPDQDTVQDPLLWSGVGVEWRLSDVNYPDLLRS